MEDYSVRIGSTCDDAVTAYTAMYIITSEEENAVTGTIWFGVTDAVLQNIIPTEDTPMISPSATFLALLTNKNSDLFFETLPSDVRHVVNYLFNM